MTVLVPQEAEIPLNTGQDTKKSLELGDAATLTAVTNLRWDRLGEIEKRPTYASTAAATVPTGSDYDSVDIEALFSRGAEVFGLTDNYGVASVDPLDPTALRYSHRLASTTQVMRYAPRACKVSRTVLERAQFGKGEGGIYQAVGAEYDGVLVIAWIEIGATRHLKYKAVDLATGATIVPTQRTAITGTLSAVQAIPYYESGAQGVLISYAYGSAAPFTVRTVQYNAAAKTFAAGLNLTTNSKYTNHQLANSASSGQNVYFAFTDNTANALKCHLGTVSAINGGASTVHTGVTAGTVPGCIVRGSTNVLIGTYSGGTVYAEVFGAPADVIAIMTAASPEGFFGMTGAQEQGDDHAVLWANTFGTETYGSFTRVRSGLVEFSSTVPTLIDQDIIPFGWIAAGGFTYEERAYVGVVLDQGADLATSVVVARHHGCELAGVYRHDPVARLCHDVFYNTGLGIFSGFGQAVVDGSAAYFLLTGDPSADAEENADTKLPQTIYLSKVAFMSEDAIPLPSAQVDRTTVIASGICIEYDGDTPSEHAPIDQPRCFVDTSVGGSTTTTGTLTVCAIWRWIDAQGRLHRSSPSPTASAPPVASKSIDVYVSRPAFSAYDGNVIYQTLEPELYVTAEDGSSFFLCCRSTGEKHAYDSGPGIGVWRKFTAIIPGVATNPPLYSTGASGSELVAEPPPAFRDIAVVGDRLWGIDAEDTSRVWFTKPFSAGFAPEWSAFCTLVVGDDCVSIRDVGGTPVVFGARGIYQIGGPGPDETGGDTTFEPPRRLPYEVSCIDPLTCATSTGVVFRTRRGFSLLSASGGLQPFGLPVDPSARVPGSLAGYSYARIVQDEVHNEVRIVDAEDQAYYVFNTLESKWSQWLQDSTVQKAADLTVADGRVWYLHDGAGGHAIRREMGSDESGYNTSAERWNEQTPWLKLDGVAGQSRLWRAWLVLTNVSDAADIDTVQVSHLVDYNNVTVQTWSWTGAELAALYAADESAVQLAMQPAKQVARAHRFSITATCTNPTPGPKPLVLRLSYGVRPGQGKRTLPNVK